MKACLSKTSAAALEIFCLEQERHNSQSGFVFRFSPVSKQAWLSLVPPKGSWGRARSAAQLGLRDRHGSEFLA
jgi:hypothetical protein